MKDLLEFVRYMAIELVVIVGVAGFAAWVVVDSITMLAMLLETLPA